MGDLKVKNCGLCMSVWIGFVKRGMLHLSRRVRYEQCLFYLVSQDTRNKVWGMWLPDVELVVRVLWVISPWHALGCCLSCYENGFSCPTCESGSEDLRFHINHNGYIPQVNGSVSNSLRYVPMRACEIAWCYHYVIKHLLHDCGEWTPTTDYECIWVI